MTLSVNVLLSAPPVLLAEQVYKLPASPLSREEMVSVELIEIYPSRIVNGDVFVMFILPPTAADQVMEGAGNPLAVQVNVTVLPSSSISVISVSGSVIVTAAEEKKLFYDFKYKLLCIFLLLLPSTITENVSVSLPTSLVTLTS